MLLQEFSGQKSISKETKGSASSLSWVNRALRTCPTDVLKLSCLRPSAAANVRKQRSPGGVTFPWASRLLPHHSISASDWLRHTSAYSVAPLPLLLRLICAQQARAKYEPGKPKKQRERHRPSLVAPTDVWLRHAGRVPDGHLADSAYAAASITASSTLTMAKVSSSQ